MNGPLYLFVDRLLVMRWVVEEIQWQGIVGDNGTLAGVAVIHFRRYFNSPVQVCAIEAVNYADFYETAHIYCAQWRAFNSIGVYA